MDTQRRILFTVLLSLAVCQTAHADVLSMDDAAQPAASSQDVARPARGMTMHQVEQRFGASQEKLPPIGDPPITRWVYPDFTVYFEHEHVIHAVLHRQAPATEQPPISNQQLAYPETQPNP